MSGSDFTATSAALFTAMTASARAVEQLVREPAAQELIRQDLKFARMTGELVRLLDSLEENWAHEVVPGQEEHFLRELRSATARCRRVRDLLVDAITAAAAVPESPPGA
ncbi:hypothetical protein ABZY05_42280 [Streptomyces canus]|uniref:hypothetical protein n=1 Tax=Streptomyces canus TaxID=58343 RepID=UPI0033AACD33